MAEPVHVSRSDLGPLKQFHRLHFPHQPVPNISSDSPSMDASTDAIDSTEDDGLGYYADGVKRTLTDEQIKMFRHSEIQRLLSERRAARQAAEQAQEQAERREEQLARKRKFYDDEAHQDNNVQALSYDEPQQADHTTEKKFLWPKLGT
jgi:hypothetical protein